MKEGNAISWRFALSGLLICVILNGCTGGGGPEPPGTDRSPSADAPPAQPNADGLKPPPPVGIPYRPIDVPLRMADDRYARFVGNTVGATYLVLANPDAPAGQGDEGTTIVRIADRKKVASYVRSAPNRQLYRVFFWRETAIVQEITNIDAGEEGARIHLSRYDLVSGSQTYLRPVDGRRLGYLGAAALAGDQFGVAIEKDGQKDRCLHIFYLATGAEADVACLPPGENGIFSIRANSSGFTYLTTAGPTLASCRTAYWIPLSTDTTAASRVIGGTHNCHAFDHARHGQWDLWSDIPAEADAINNHTAAVLRAQKGPLTITIGPIDTGSVISCGDHLYWRRPDPTDRRFTQVARWRPGAAYAEIIYQANTNHDDEQWSVTFPACSQNVVTVTQYRPGPNPPASKRMFYLPEA